MKIKNSDHVVHERASSRFILDELMLVSSSFSVAMYIPRSWLLLQPAKTDIRRCVLKIKSCKSLLYFAASSSTRKNGRRKLLASQSTEVNGWGQFDPVSESLSPDQFLFWKFSLLALIGSVTKSKNVLLYAFYKRHCWTTSSVTISRRIVLACLFAVFNLFPNYIFHYYPNAIMTYVVLAEAGLSTRTP
jgi:hypothetical protein